MLPSRSWTSSFPPPRSVASKRLNKARHFTLPVLVVLSMTTLILSTIYTYCVHQNNHSRAAILQGVTPITPTISSSSPSSSSPSSSSISTRDEVWLVFYSMTLPLVSLSHGLIEATLLKFTPQTLTRTNANFHTPYFLLGTSLLLTAGWVVTASFWTHCELALTHSSVCPPPVRDHLMYGILELSIVKATLGWTLMAAYLLHAAFLIVWLRTVLRWAHLKRGMVGVGATEWEPEDKERVCARCEQCACGAASRTSWRSSTTTTSDGGVGQVTTDKKSVKISVVPLPSPGLSTVSLDHGPPKEVPFFPPPPKRPVK